ncbi:MAG: tetratricopeptide repeat protein [Alphaproteobacteria bacterium]|nr:tetratricopeptide repeat protein [Alphaproteobacteria bacterium]
MASLLDAQTLYRNGDLLGAQAACFAVIQEDPQNIDALYLLAVTAIDCNGYELAGQILDKLMEIRPDRADIFGTAGVLALRLGEPATAARRLAHACSRATDLAPYLQNLAPTLGLIGMKALSARYAHALAALFPGSPETASLVAQNGGLDDGARDRAAARWLAMQPHAPEALTLLLTGGMRPAAKAALRHRLTALHPDDAELTNTAGAAAIQSGARTEATRLLGRSLAMRPTASAVGNLAVLVAQTPTPASRAAVHLTAPRLAGLAIALAPESPQAWEAMANVEDLASAPGTSIPYWRRCLALTGNPDFAVGLAAALRMADRLDEAEGVARQAVLSLRTGSPGQYRAAATFAAILRARNKPTEAVEAVGFIPPKARSPGIAVRDALTLPVVLEGPNETDRWRDRLVARLDALEAEGLRLTDPFREVGQTAFHAAYHGLDDRPLQERIARFFRASCPPLTFTAPHVVAGGAAGPRIRVGFVSRFLKDHTIGKLMGGLITGLDRTRFEVTLLPFAAQSDAFTKRIGAAVDRHVPLPTDLFAARAAIAAQELDVLFYCDIGMDPLTYFLAYARLAPVQCVTWGHPVTTGLESIDAFLSADSIERPGAEADYTEKLIRLPRLPAVYGRPAPAQDMAGVRDPVAGLPRVYSCPQSTFKFHPDFDAVWAGILERDRDARLVIVEGKDQGWDETLKRRFADAHPAVADRLVILPRLRRGAFFKLLDRSAATLDPLHFGSGNTAYETFAVGTPIVTLPGRYMRGRVTDGCYRQMGIDALRADTVEDYIERAVRLGADPDWRAYCKDLILTSNAALYDDMAAVRAVEQCLLDLVAARC